MEHPDPGSRNPEAGNQVSTNYDAVWTSALQSHASVTFPGNILCVVIGRNTLDPLLDFRLRLLKMWLAKRQTCRLETLTIIAQVFLERVGAIRHP